MRVCVTGATVSVMASVRSVVERLGGAIVERVEDKDTVLVCMRVGTAKYEDARAVGARIVAVQWVQRCRDEDRFVPTADCKVGALEGLRVSITSFADTTGACMRASVCARDWLGVRKACARASPRPLPACSLRLARCALPGCPATYLLAHV